MPMEGERRGPHWDEEEERAWLHGEGWIPSPTPRPLMLHPLDSQALAEDHTAALHDGSGLCTEEHTAAEEQWFTQQAAEPWAQSEKHGAATTMAQSGEWLLGESGVGEWMREDPSFVQQTAAEAWDNEAVEGIEVEYGYGEWNWWNQNQMGGMG